jgi:hypothetical protein
LLERVRAKGLAMHSSSELVEASDTMFLELQKLKINTIRVGIGIIDKPTIAWKFGQDLK